MELDLVYDYADQPKRESVAWFEGVRLHKFEFTTGAIITFIEEIPVSTWVAGNAEMLQRWPVQLAADWTDQGLRVWFIDSAIGFNGFVIGRSVG